MFFWLVSLPHCSFSFFCFFCVMGVVCWLWWHRMLCVSDQCCFLGLNMIRQTTGCPESWWTFRLFCFLFQSSCINIWHTFIKQQTAVFITSQPPPALVSDLCGARRLQRKVREHNVFSDQIFKDEYVHIELWKLKNAQNIVSRRNQLLSATKKT